MRKRCGWCGTIMEAGDPPETTGICPPCEEKYFPVEVVAFDWDHPAISISHGPRNVSDLSVPWFVRPSMDTDLYGIFLLVCSLVAAFLIGTIWGAA